MSKAKKLMIFLFGIFVLLVMYVVILPGHKNEYAKQPSEVASKNINPDDNEWFVMRNSARVGDNGQTLTECVKSDMSPQQVMDGARKAGLTYEVIDDLKESSSGVASAVSIFLNTNEGKRNLVFFRGKDFCLFSSQQLTGKRAHDPSAYK